MKIIVDECNSGERADKLIAEKTGISRSYAAKLIENGSIRFKDGTIKASLKVKTGDEILVNMPEPVEYNAEKEDISLDIVYEDKDILVVNKPQGMVVHPAAGNYSKTLVNALLNHCGDNLSGINGVMRPGIVHRIDKDTSGLLLVAKNDKAHNSLSSQLAKHSIKREYIALLHGKFKEKSGTINLPLGRSVKDRKKMAVNQPHSREAVTHYEVLEEFPRYSLAKLRLETGRTHQIRVHMSHKGHPVAGDKTYCGIKEGFSASGQLLHAKTIGFMHPSLHTYMEFSKDVPDYFEEILKKLRGV